jgi:damage-control phosphatase, subfamily I
MQTNVRCLPCFIKQATKLTDMLNLTPESQKKILSLVLQKLKDLDYSKTPPEMGRTIQEMVSGQAKIADPYFNIKELYNSLIMEMVPKLEKEIFQAENSFDFAVRLAIAGNIIDFGNQYTCTKEVVENSINSCLTEEIIGSTPSDVEFQVRKAKSILYIGDNCGEIVLDKFLIKEIGPEKTTFVVRGRPTLNDVTMKDAIDTKMVDLVKVIDTGSNVPGVVLSDVSEEFLHHYNDVDLIIAKGQGNFETMSDLPRPIIFLLKAKCDVIADYLQVKTGSMIIKMVNVD